MKTFQPIYGHHSEPTDTELLQWLVEAIDLTLGYNRWLVITTVAIIVIVFPLAVMLLAKYRSR